MWAASRPSLASLFWLVAMSAVGLAGCISAADRSQTGASQFSAAAQSLKAAISEGVSAQRFPGAVYMVAIGDRLLYDGVLGVSDIDKNTPMQRESIFRAMSMTKPVTAIAVMMLVDAGKLQLDQPVSRHLPEFGALRGEADGQTPVTIWNLLTHTGGGGFGAIPVGTATLAERVAEIARRKPSVAPGTRWQYSGFDGFDVLARVVEVSSGQAYDVFLKEHLFDPLGMKDTAYVLNADQQARTVPLYAARNGALVADRPPFPDPTYPAGGAGLYTTAPDYLRLAQMLANGGTLDGVEILRPDTVRAMSKAQLAGGSPGLPPGLAWGLGMRRVEDPTKLNSALASGAFGWSGAYGTHFWIDPQRKLAAVWMINLTTAGGASSPDALEFERLVMAACTNDPLCAP